jgi:hypothetical protein
VGQRQPPIRPGDDPKWAQIETNLDAVPSHGKPGTSTETAETSETAS